MWYKHKIKHQLFHTEKQETADERVKHSLQRKQHRTQERSSF